MTAMGWKRNTSLRTRDRMDTTGILDPREFWLDWDKHHKGRQPLGYVLRQDGSLPWVRFHALPASKRYAESEQESEIILSRGNILASAMLEPSQKCWIISSRCDGEAGPGVPAGGWTEDESDPESLVWKFFVRDEAWANGKFNDALKDLANDTGPYLTWFEPENGRIYAPYDGGFDLFPASLEEAQALKLRFSDWLSDREDGL